MGRNILASIYGPPTEIKACHHLFHFVWQSPHGRQLRWTSEGSGCRGKGICLQAPTTAFGVLEGSTRTQSCTRSSINLPKQMQHSRKETIISNSFSCRHSHAARRIIATPFIWTAFSKHLLYTGDSGYWEQACGPCSFRRDRHKPAMGQCHKRHGSVQDSSRNLDTFPVTARGPNLHVPS